jgi:hypothetical protein
MDILSLMVALFHRLMCNRTGLDCGARKRGIKARLITPLWKTSATHAMTKPELP